MTKQLKDLVKTVNSIKPNIILVLGDREEAMSAAIAGSYMNIPVAHIQGGEVTGSIDEKVRHAVTKLSNYHFVSNKLAYERVIKMGENKESVFLTGCPSIDLALNVFNNPNMDTNPINKYGGVGSKIDLSSGYYVVMHHPVTTEFDESRDQVNKLLNAVHNIGKPILWFWPNVDAGSDTITDLTTGDDLVVRNIKATGIGTVDGKLDVGGIINSSTDVRINGSSVIDEAVAMAIALG